MGQPVIEELEIWKPVTTHIGLYEVSNHGRVRRVDRVKGSRPGRILKPQMREGGLYYTLVLYNRCKPAPVYIHDLVAAAFIGPKPQGLHVNHKDLDKLNNHICNLEYTTPRENIRHAVKHGAFANHHLHVKRGEDCAFHKLTEGDIPVIKNLINEGESLQSIALRYGVSKSTIWFIRQGKTWKHLNRKAA